MFEPVHGSAPDIAGRAIANPIGRAVHRRPRRQGAHRRCRACHCRRLATALSHRKDTWLIANRIRFRA